jgi:TRAP-type C4-dicarboxylate transport system permease large subunit
MVFAGKYQKDKSEKMVGSKIKILFQGIIPLLMPIFVVGSILFGVVTPTEAASFAVAYALIVGQFLLREIKWSDLPRIFGNAMRDKAVIMIVMLAVAAANWLMTYNRIPNIITDFALRYMTSKWMFLVGIVRPPARHALVSARTANTGGSVLFSQFC